jgi:hypothetical protein
MSFFAQESTPNFSHFLTHFCRIHDLFVPVVFPQTIFFAYSRVFSIFLGPKKPSYQWENDPPTPKKVGKRYFFPRYFLIFVALRKNFTKFSAGVGDKTHFCSGKQGSKSDPSVPRRPESLRIKKWVFALGGFRQRPQSG